MSNELNKYNSKILERIHIIRGEKVMLDFDLAELYNVETKRLKEQVKRNISRFPQDFMFELTEKEFLRLRSQNATANLKTTRYLPLAFTEQGIAMLSTVLNSELAISVNIQIIRLFTFMRKKLMENKDLMLKMEEIERKLLHHDGKMKSFELEIQLIFQTLKKLLDPAKPEREKIGFKIKE
jgi:ORF6N domain